MPCAEPRSSNVGDVRYPEARPRRLLPRLPSGFMPSAAIASRLAPSSPLVINIDRIQDRKCGLAEPTAVRQTLIVPMRTSNRRHGHSLVSDGSTVQRVLACRFGWRLRRFDVWVGEAVSRKLRATLMRGRCPGALHMFAHQGAMVKLYAVGLSVSVAADDV
jgi:hypothetical protein